MKNILLVVPPSFSIKMLQEEINNLKNQTSDFTRSVDWGICAPLGILYIAGTLRKFGYDVQIYDLHRAFYLCREGGYFKENDLSDFFEDYFDRILQANKIDVLGISCLFNVASTTVKEMGLRCKRVSPSTVIVLGGHYPNIMYRELLKEEVCHYIILGEAEEEFIGLLNYLGDSFINQEVCVNPHIVGSKCSDKVDRRAAMIQDLDDLAMPAWDLLPYCEDYIRGSIHTERVGSSLGNKSVRSAGIMTTRGCPMGCTFCAARGVHGRKMRSHSIEYVMRQIDWLVNSYDINHLLIEDDMFNFSPARVIKFCKGLTEKYNGRFGIEFPNGLAVWLLNEDVIIHLKKAGMKSITIGIESGSQYIQKAILKKNLELAVVREKVELLKKHDISVRAFYMVGLVGETMEMMGETVQFALDLNIDWSEIKVFTPLVGSEMYEIAREKGYLVGDTSEHVYGRCSVRTPEFTPEQVENLRYDANIRINFLNQRSLKEEKFDIAEKLFSKILNTYHNHLFAQWGFWKALEGQGKKEEADQALKTLINMTKGNQRNRLLLEKYNIKLQ